MTDEIRTFDFVFVQFYETFSQLVGQIVHNGIKPSDAIVQAVKLFDSGWNVDFRTDKVLGYPFEDRIVIEATR